MVDYRNDDKHMKKVICYMPIFGPVQVHAKVFKSFVELIMTKVEGYEIVPFLHDVGPELSFNRNDAVERIIGTYDPEFIYFADADNIVPRNVISRLLASMDKDIGAVSALYFKKTFPHSAVQGHFLPWDDQLEKKRKSLESQGLIAEDGSQLLYYRPLRYFDVVRPVDVIGMGSVLLRASIFKQLRQPYFKYISQYSTGDYTFGLATEDLWFCAQLKKYGIKIFCDPKIVSGHLVTKVIQGSELEASCVQS